MYMCIWWPVMDLHPIQGVFLLHTQYPWDRLWIHYHTDQDKALNKDE